MAGPDHGFPPVQVPVQVRIVWLFRGGKTEIVSVAKAFGEFELNGHSQTLDAMHKPMLIEPRLFAKDGDINMKQEPV
jgi:hypothetical protein